MTKIGIICKDEDKLIAGTARQLAAELRPHYQAVTDPKKFKSAAFILTLGGDGTILRAAGIASQIDRPILGLHLGGLGLLSEIQLEDLSSALKAIQEKKYMIDERAMLEATVLRRQKPFAAFVALNDVVIGKNEIARTIKLEAYTGKDILLANYAADGLIVSTATGSTAYNFAVGGPILPPHSSHYVLSPICPHRAADRSLVLDEPVVINITKGQKVLLTADGQQTFKLQPGDTVQIKVSKKSAKFIRLAEYDLWKLMREKLGWA